MIDLNIISLEDSGKRQEISRKILMDLPEWFGIEESTKGYVEKSIEGEFLAAECYIGNQNEIVGFMNVIYNNEFTGEIFSMGILKKFHNKGIGMLMVKRGEEILKNRGIEYMMVKTLGPSDPDENYNKTRDFYYKCGFRPMQELSEIWGKDNPCLIMVKKI